MATVNYSAVAAESSVEDHLNTRAIDMTSQSELDKLLSHWLKLHFDALLSSACPPFGFGLRHIETTACVKIQRQQVTRTYLEKVSRSLIMPNPRVLLSNYNAIRKDHRHNRGHESKESDQH
ncbi:hypothetical protein Peur_026698 [Populus x canadensis]